MISTIHTFRSRDGVCLIPAVLLGLRILHQNRFPNLPQGNWRKKSVCWAISASDMQKLRQLKCSNTHYWQLEFSLHSTGILSYKPNVLPSTWYKLGQEKKILQMSSLWHLKVWSEKEKCNCLLEKSHDCDQYEQTRQKVNAALWHCKCHQQYKRNLPRQPSKFLLCLCSAHCNSILHFAKKAQSYNMG